MRVSRIRRCWMVGLKTPSQTSCRYNVSRSAIPPPAAGKGNQITTNAQWHHRHHSGKHPCTHTMHAAHEDHCECTACSMQGTHPGLGDAGDRRNLGAKPRGDIEAITGRAERDLILGFDLAHVPRADATTVLVTKRVASAVVLAAVPAWCHIPAEQRERRKRARVSETKLRDKRKEPRKKKRIEKKEKRIERGAYDRVRRAAAGPVRP